ncbi:MAG: hypothetical protein H6Q20_1237 [Bacteroidetes bacterium]|jgi:hypothetical protein|nr:hypothetical protein [Bacteroidota bacterium]
MGFFNLYKPREYKHRYIYYDPEKEALKERQKEWQKEMAANDDTAESKEYRPTIRRGTFREMADKNRNMVKVQEARKANIRLLVIILALLALMYYILV